jgi:hypothetical protein
MNENLQEISKDIAARVVNFAKSKNLTVKSAIFPHCNIRNFTWTSPDERTHNQINHILMDMRQCADCDTAHYLVVAEVRE